MKILKKHKKALSICVIAICIIFCLNVDIVKSSTNKKSITETSYDKEEILKEIYEFDPNFDYRGELISVSKDINKSDMTIYMIVSKIEDDENDTFEINAIAKWNSSPLFRMEDAFALSWDKEFALINSKCITSYLNQGIIEGTTTLIATAPNNGVGYNIEASNSYKNALDWTKITAEISQTNRAGNANIYTAYAHQSGTLDGISITFSSENILFRASGFIDLMSNNNTTFDY